MQVQSQELGWMGPGEALKGWTKRSRVSLDLSCRFVAAPHGPKGHTPHHKVGTGRGIGLELKIGFELKVGGTQLGNGIQLCRMINGCNNMHTRQHTWGCYFTVKEKSIAVTVVIE
jgi:hypothetical protein